ncbi:MAG: DUF3488 domain-containing transglutaminase family protein [Xanthomonadales bacterium]|nr:DUF3488 domain-containing transglutaminase family protein [Xanthomonadales bacterium]
MKLNNQQAGMLWAIFTITIALIPQALSMPVQLLPLIVLPIAWRIVAELRGWRPMPLLARIAATAMTVFFLVMTYGGLFGRRAAVSLLTVMLALKLLETFKVRDARIVASLSLFLCATQFLFSQGLFMLVYAASVMLGALVALTLLQRRDAFTGKGTVPPSNHGFLQELGYSTKLVAMAAPAALVLFMLFPRWGGPMWGVPESALDAKTGLSDSMAPGDIQNLFMDDSPAFRVEFDSPIPMIRDLYWRGPVFWNFDGRAWSGAYYSRNVPAETLPDITPDSIRYRVQMEPTERHWMFALDYPAITPNRSRVTIDFQLLTRPITRLRSYDMVSNPDFVDMPELKIILRTSALKLPEGYNPRTLELVQEWRDEADSDSEFIDRILRWFNTEEFSYTLNPPLLSQHTVDEFLFDTRKGFCEHYASAFTVMMRMAGIPARIVTGYMGGYHTGSYLLVRQSDAHAWSEVWLEGRGWVRVDPTAAVAPGRIESGAMNALSSRRYMFDYEWIRSLKNNFDLLQRGWNEWVIAFGLEQQSRLFQPFGMERLDSTKLVVILVIAITLIAALMSPLLLRLRISSNRDAAAKLWDTFRRKLDKAGINTSAAMTPEELGQAATTVKPGEAEEIGRISALYRQIRYAPDAPPLESLRKAVRGFRAARQGR